MPIPSAVSIGRRRSQRPGGDVESERSEQRERLTALLGERLGPAAKVITARDRQLAVDLLAPDEAIRAVAVGRLQGRAMVTGQLYVATDARLIISEAHRWKASWHRTIEWDDVEGVALSDGHLLIELEAETLVVRSPMPATAADQFDELRRRSGSPATDDGPTAEMAATLAEQLPRFPGWMNERAVHRLLHELSPSETVQSAMRFGVVRSGVVVLTDRRIGRLPDAMAEPSDWWDRDQVWTVSLDDEAGLLVRTPSGEREWTGLIPADELPDLVRPLLADNRRRERARSGSGDPAAIAAPASDREPAALPPGVRRSEIDGVPVFWVERPASPRLSAQLLFGVGQADEPFTGGHITHLLEHVVMRRFTDATYETNAGVGVWVTSFDVESRPATVTRHLREVCETIGVLAAIPPDPVVVETEREFLRAEEAQADGPGLAMMLPAAAWFGRSGVGLVGESTLGLENADPDALTDWCRHWFVRGNAALVLDGPPPEDLTLPLPAGDHPRRTPPSPRPLDTPAFTPGPPGFQVSFRARRNPHTEMLIETLTVRWTRLFRHDHGLVYDIATTVIGLPGGEIIVSLSADAAPQHGERIAALLTDDLHALSVDGVAEKDVTAARDRLVELTEDPHWPVGLATDHAVWSVGGPVPIPAVDLDSAARINRTDVNRAWEAARETLIVASDVEVPDLPFLETDRTPIVTGRSWTRARKGSYLIEGSSAISGPDGVSLRWGPAEDEDWRTVRYDDVVALGIDRLAPQDAVVALFSRTGALVGLRARDWRDGQHLVREVLLTVPAHLHTYLPDRMRPYDLGEE